MTADSMEAYVMLITPDDGGEYTIESLQKALDDRGVKYGIDEAALTELIDEKKYGVETLVAQGTEPVDGKDGYYCFHAGTKLTDKAGWNRGLLVCKVDRVCGAGSGDRGVPSLCGGNGRQDSHWKADTCKAGKRTASTERKRI